MKGSPDVLKNLQSLLAVEYHVNLQYRNDAVALKFLGVPKLAGKFKKFANQSHEFYQGITKRIMVLGGDASADVGKIDEQATIPELFQNALSAENNMCAIGISGIQIAVRAGDETTAEKLRHIEERHEDRVAWLERQLGLIEQLGIQMYLSEKL